jgi:hypothetical protein
MKLQKIQSVIPFISLPLGMASLILLLIEFSVRASLISQNPLSQLILFAGFITNVALLLLSFRAVSQVLSQKTNK